MENMVTILGTICLFIIFVIICVTMFQKLFTRDIQSENIIREMDIARKKILKDIEQMQTKANVMAQMIEEKGNKLPRKSQHALSSLASFRE